MTGPAAAGREPAELRTLVAAPLVFCVTCRTQVLLSDAIGRPTSPTFVRVATVGTTDELVCVFCAGRAEQPAELAPLWLCRDRAGFVPGCAPALPELDTWALLVRLGANLEVTR